MIVWAILVMLCIVALGSIGYVWLLDREIMRAGRERDGLPVIGRDELVPRATAHPGAIRRQRRRLDRERRAANPNLRSLR